ncbi:hypothetical protein Tco_0185720 [Tanacetum coccineum]
MSNLKFAETHNLVAFLEKPKESDGFEGIIDFLNASSIRYALTVNPTIYTSCIKQFWATAKAKTVNGEVQIQALVDGKKVIVTETSVRRALQLKDAEGTECLPNATIFAELERMGYENLTQKLTFYKAFFSPQWKFLIHTILQCLSAKTTAWNEFSSTMASVVIYTKVPQPSGSTKPIIDEAANEEHVPTHSNDPLLSDKDRLQLKELAKKLERRNKLSTPGLKRLRKVGRTARIESSEDEVFDEQEVEVEKAVSTAKVTTVSATTTIVDELTLAQTLIEIKAAKPKAVTTATTTTTTAVTRPKARGVVVQETSEFRTTTSSLQTSQLPLAKDKGKAKMIESEKPLKKKDQILIDEEIAQKLQAQINAKLEEEEKLNWTYSVLDLRGLKSFN